MPHLLYLLLRLLQLLQRGPSFLVRIVAQHFGRATLTTVAEVTKALIIVSHHACGLEIWRFSRRFYRSVLRLLAADMNLLS